MTLLGRGSTEVTRGPVGVRRAAPGVATLEAAPVSRGPQPALDGGVVGEALDPRVERLAEPLRKSGYGDYLMQVLAEGSPEKHVLQEVDP